MFMHVLRFSLYSTFRSNRANDDSPLYFRTFFLIFYHSLSWQNGNTIDDCPPKYRYFCLNSGLITPTRKVPWPNGIGNWNELAINISCPLAIQFLTTTTTTLWTTKPTRKTDRTMRLRRRWSTFRRLCSQCHNRIAVTMNTSWAYWKTPQRPTNQMIGFQVWPETLIWLMNTMVQGGKTFRKTMIIPKLYSRGY